MEAYKPHIVTLLDPGTLTVANQAPSYVAPHKQRIRSARAYVGTAATGTGSATFTLRKNGSVVATLVIPVTEQAVAVEDIDVELEAGDTLALGTTVIGGTVAGADGVVAVVIED